MNVIQPCRVDFTPENGLCIYAGSSWVVPVTICQRENLKDEPMDITGYEGRASIKMSLSDATPLAEPEVEISDSETGLFTISLGSELTQNLPTPGKCFCDIAKLQYEVRLTDKESGEEYRALYGDVFCIPSAFDSDDN